jgi:cyclophilin family peptidyl-prolyl cis-trans isomerase
MSKKSLALGLLFLCGILYYLYIQQSPNKEVNQEINIIEDNNTEITKKIPEKQNIQLPEQVPVKKIINKNNMEQPTENYIEEGKTHKAILKTTEGDVTIVFDAINSPKTANNFIYLAKNSFYDDTIFHRVIKGFMIQGGDPQGTGMGGPGYKFEDEYLGGEYTRGTMAMANSGANTNGSQFFIMHSDYPLPKSYVVFAQVEAGLEIVDKIADAKVDMGIGGENSSPINPVKIEKVEIIIE